MSRMIARLLLACLIGLLLPVGAGTTRVSADQPWDFSNDAWAYLRAKTPPERQVYRPTWLPARFRQQAVASTVGLLFGVSYDSDAGDRLYLGSTANSCGGGGGTSEPITVLGHEGTLYTSTECAPEIWFAWTEGDQSYRVMGYKYNGTSALTRDEMLRIAASLSPVGVDGRPLTQGGPPTRECFVETGECLTGRFLDRWRATGGDQRLPAHREFTATLEDGNAYTVQYFERVRLEYHPENAASYDVLLGQFGRRIHPADPPVAPIPNTPQYFPETGHNLSGQFYYFWQEYGLAQFGYPISEELTETLEDGNAYLVQYFERARLEYHPENASPYTILLGQFGRRILADGIPNNLTLTPSSGPCTTNVAVHGTGFAPGAGTRFVLRRDRDGAITAANTSAGGLPVAADGTYATTLQLIGCGPDEPSGSTFTITVYEYYPDRTPTLGPGASATFTVIAP
ncbi:MAG: hypothetical protein U0232_11940 [Thermomicrobiales bacterium]